MKSLKTESFFSSINLLLVYTEVCLVHIFKFDMQHAEGI